jgi:hypothetical protein
MPRNLPLFRNFRSFPAKTGNLGPEFSNLRNKFWLMTCLEESMNRSLALALLFAFSPSLILLAQDGRRNEFKNRNDPVLYAMVSKFDIGPRATIGNYYLPTETAKPASKGLNSRVIEHSPRLSFDEATFIATDRPVSIGLSYSQNRSKRESWLQSKERIDRKKFSVVALMEGSVYDFKKKNDLRLEVGTPELRDAGVEPVDTRYEKPFCIMFMLSLKL